MTDYDCSFCDMFMPNFIKAAIHKVCAKAAYDYSSISNTHHLPQKHLSSKNIAKSSEVLETKLLMIKECDVEIFVLKNF